MHSGSKCEGWVGGGCVSLDHKASLPKTAIICLLNTSVNYRARAAWIYRQILSSSFASYTPPRVMSQLTINFLVLCGLWYRSYGSYVYIYIYIVNAGWKLILYAIHYMAQKMDVTCVLPQYRTWFPHFHPMQLPRHNIHLFAPTSIHAKDANLVEAEELIELVWWNCTNSTTIYEIIKCYGLERVFPQTSCIFSNPKPFKRLSQFCIIYVWCSIYFTRTLMLRRWINYI